MAARTPYIIDTSVALKWYIPEAHAVEAQAYMGKGLDRHAPDYLPAEAASVMLKRIRTQDAFRVQARRCDLFASGSRFEV